MHSCSAIYKIGPVESVETTKPVVEESAEVPIHDNHFEGNHRKPRNAWKIFFACAVLAALVLSLFLILTNSRIQGKEAEFAALEAQYEQMKTNMTDLQNSYADLQVSYSELQSAHSSLQITYSGLQNSYDSLNSDYDALRVKYSMLFQDPPNLQTAFARSLENKQVPNLNQLQNWLATDATSTNQYNDPDFVCTDFAAMLVVHARTQEWKMGLAFVYGYDTSTNQAWNHAFNAIITTEGLVYVEPQNDGVWWYSGHAAIQAGGSYEMEQYNPVMIHVNEIIIAVSY